MRRHLLPLSCLGIFALLLTLSLTSWHIESLDLYVRDKVQSLSEKHLPINIRPGKTTVQLLPPSVQINNIQVIPRKELHKKINSFQIQSLKIQPSLFSLIFGKFWLSKIEISGAKINILTKIKSDQEKQKIILHEILSSIPITHLQIEKIDISAALNHGKNNYYLKSSHLNASITNGINHVVAKINGDDISFNMNKKPITDNTKLSTQFFLTNKNFVLSRLNIKSPSGDLLITGSSRHNLAKEKIKSASLNVNVRTTFDEIESYFNLFKNSEDENPFTKMDGRIQANFQTSATSLENYHIKTRSKIFHASYDNFKIGTLQAIASYGSTEKIIKLQTAKLSSPGIEASIGQSQMSLDDLVISNVPLHVQRFTLNPFLKYAKNIDLPANVTAQGKVKCSGTITPLKITCPGLMSAKDIDVKIVNKKEQTKKPLVHFSEVSAIGQGTLTAKDISFKGELESEHSKGRSHGSVNYKKGFKIFYEADSLDLSEVGKIADLEFLGTAKLKGITQGNSQTATLKMDIETQNLIFEKYKLGSVSGSLRYARGDLILDRIQGAISSSRYLGNLKIDLPKERLAGTVQFPFVDLAVLKDSVKEHLDIPVDISGSGSAVVSIDSPLNPKKLSFKVKSRLYNCTVDQQHLDTIDLNADSKLGIIKFRNTIFEEKNSKINLNGSMSLERQSYDLTFNTKKIFLSDIVYTKSIGAPSSGSFLAEGAIKGPFKQPRVISKFSSNNFKLSGQQLSPLIGSLSADKKQQILKLNGPNDLSIKYDNLSSRPHSHLEGKMSDVDLAPVLTNLLSVDAADDYKIISTNSFNLKINKKNPSLINGYISSPKTELLFGKSSMTNQKEISIFFTNGKMNFSPFQMQGGPDSIEIRSISNSRHPIDIKINGLFNLSFLQIFTPFLETLEGLTSLNLEVRSDYKTSEFIGSGYISDAFVKLPHIEHPVEDLKIDILFNQDRLRINSIRGKFASGKIIGDGTVLLKGKRNLPTNINLHLEAVSLNIPEQVKTQGNADLKLNGNWLPFTLSGKYDITGGLITKELAGGDSSAESPHEVFLPPNLRTQVKSPIHLDLDITPQIPLKVNNSLLEGKLLGHLKIIGSAESPSFAGNMKITKNSDLKFKEVAFKVQDSNISFKRQSPPNPSLYILATTRYRDYDIEMQVLGTASKPRFRMTSQPTLTEQEIISLLTLGYTGEVRSQIGANNDPDNQSTMEIGTGLLSKNPLGKEFKNRFGFDIQFSSSFDEENSVAVPKISLSRPISENVSLTVSHQTGQDSKTDAKFRYDLRKDISATLSFEQNNADEAVQETGNQQIQDILGVDMEYRLEFE